MGHLLAVLLPALTLLMYTSRMICLRKLFVVLCKPGSQDASSTKKQEEHLQDSSRAKYKFHMKMDLHSFDQEKWLTVDNNYLLEHEVRSRLLKEKRTSVLGCSPKSEAACEEALQVILDNLLLNYPEVFRRSKNASNVDCVENVLTAEKFEIQAPFEGMEPLEIAARLAMEDFNIILMNDDHVHALEASATCFPVGWAVNERLGWPIYQIHGAVPMWQDKLRHPVERFLSKVAVGKMMERLPYFVQVADLNSDLAKILCQVGHFDFVQPPTDPATIILRGERQTFRRLPQSGAVLFSVKTTLRPLTALGPDELKQFIKEVVSWPEVIAEYKGRNCWGDCAFRYAEKVAPGSVPTANKM